MAKIGCKPNNYWDAGYSGNLVVAIQNCVKAYREWWLGIEFTLDWREPAHFKDWLKGGPGEERRRRIKELRGKDLACWCPLDQLCHADVLLEIANLATGGTE